MKRFDWSRPQRQPVAGLAVVFVNTFWEVLKRIWPFVIISLLGRSEGGKGGRWAVMSLVFLVLVTLGALLRFLYFRFHIEDGKLIIKSGWLRKETKVIPLEKIQSVQTEQGPLHQVLNIVKLSIDTAGTQTAEAVIDALSKPMAEDLRTQLLAEKRNAVDDGKSVAPAWQAIARLGGRDLLKLSLSANHLQTFALLLSFGIGLYENLTDIDDSLFSGWASWLPAGAVSAVLFFAALVLLVTVVISTARTFFRFYNFTVARTTRGFQITGGLLNVKERLVALRKIQFVSWKQSWLRRLAGMWMLEYHVAGGNGLKLKMRVQVPVTQEGYIPALVKSYHAVPQVAEADALRMHPSFVARRTLVQGLLPALLLMAALWPLWGYGALLPLLYTASVFVFAWCAQRKFRLWVLPNAVYVRKGFLGEERILLQWHKLQSVEWRQSVYQRRKGLASVTIHTAGGAVNVHFIPLTAARQLANLALYKTEALNKGWM